MDLQFLDTILASFDAATSNWAATLQPIALSLFWSLGTIEWTFTFIKQILANRAGIGEIFYHMIFKFFYLAFLYWLILKAPAILPMIVASFQKAGGAAGGVDVLHPSAFLNLGLKVAIQMISSVNVAGLLIDPFSRSIVLIGAFAAVILFALMSASILLTLIESYLIVSGVGQILLGFAACRWTYPLAQSALSTVFRIGVKLMITYMVASVFASLMATWSGALTSVVSPLDYLAFLGSLLVACVLIFTLPTRLASYLVPATMHLGLNPMVTEQ